MGKSCLRFKCFEDIPLNLIGQLFKRMSVSVAYGVESANSATIKHMVIAGMGLGLLPETAVAGELRRGQLVRLEVPTLIMSQEIMLYFRKNRTMSATRAQFMQFLQDYYAPKPTRKPGPRS